MPMSVGHDAAPAGIVKVLLAEQVTPLAQSSQLPFP